MDFGSSVSFVAAGLAVILGVATALLERRGGRGRWLFFAGMLALGGEALVCGLSAAATPVLSSIGLEADLQVLRQRDLQIWRLSTMSFLPGLWLLFSFVYARGNAREFLNRWWWGIGLALVVPPALVLGSWFTPETLVIPQISGPEQLIKAFGLGSVGQVINLVVLLSGVLVLMNLERTYRAAVGTMRWRIKFMALGLGVLFAVRTYTSSQVLLYKYTTFSWQALNSGALILACLLIARSLFRTGHFDVNVYPSQAILHNSLTVLLAGIYLFIVGVLAKLVGFFGGDTALHLKALVILVALVLLAMLLLSDRLRLRTRQFVSRHFQRPIYDYRSVWRTFTEGTARRVERLDFCTAVAKLVSEIFQALSVTMWLVDEKRENLTFAASTSLSPAKATQMELEGADARGVITALTAHVEPVDLDTSKEIWAASLRRVQPEQFRKGGNRVCVPLHAGGELIGLLLLGDRVSGAPFSVQDFDLLRSVGDQAAAGLLNIQLSQRLSQAKQLEAFQAMSAFFVHDLKNTASTLTLMLQNLPVHYNDPQFREDALRGISKTVSHINDLIGRLNMLRHEMAIQPRDCDLNEVVREALSGQQGAQGVELTQELRPVPHARLDPLQIQKVVTNLVLNAREALSAGGHIRVETSSHDGWVILSVTDDGCGMTPEFIQTRLFRPFQTTKKKGIGIGMFHCKMIVEAHHGRIEVQSDPGKGSTFNVFLPAVSEPQK